MRQVRSVGSCQCLREPRYRQCANTDHTIHPNHIRENAALGLLIANLASHKISYKKAHRMKPFFAFAAVCMCLVLNSGCSEHSTATKTEEITTPGGKTTITTQQDIKKTGDHKDK